MKKIISAMLFAALAAPMFTSCEKDGGENKPATYSITMSADANGSAEARIGNKVVTEAEAGATIIIAATPNADYKFKQWVAVSGSLPAFTTGSATNSTATFTMPDGAVNIKAEFESEAEPVTEYDITISDDGNGTAEATVGDTAVTTAVAGATVTITATPAANYVFKQWVAASGSLPTFATGDAATSPATFTMPAAEVNIKAEFEPAPYAITMTNDGHGTAAATVDGTAVTTAAAGATVTITATPSTDYMFKQWVAVGGTLPTFVTGSATTSPVTFTMPAAAVNIKAEFISPTSTSATINGLTWAACNVDGFGTFAAKPESYGMFYQWNRPKAWPATGAVTGWDSSMPTSNEWAAANDPCPTGWRVPTKDEQAKLLDASKVDRSRTALNSVNGYKFTDKTSGATIFFPAAGNRTYSDGKLFVAGIDGFYWSGTSSSTDPMRIWFLSLLGNAASPSQNSDYRGALGFSVRCVRP